MADDAPATVVMLSNYGRIEEFDEHPEDWIRKSFLQQITQTMQRRNEL